MSIVNVLLPAGKSKAFYGQVELGVEDGVTDVPKYVAKSLVAAGATCNDPLVGSAAAMLAATATGFEANYIFQAYGKQLDDLAAANELLATRGEPAVRFE